MPRVFGKQRFEVPTAPKPAPSVQLPPASLVYVPPEAPPPAPPEVINQNEGADYEAVTSRVTVSTVKGVTMARSQEIPVYRTRKRRRGVDVYVDASQLAVRSGATVRILVYGISANGGRALVSTGNLEISTNGAGGVLTATSWPQASRLVCSSRAICEAFEITLVYFDTAGAPGARLQQVIPVTVVASDEATDPDPSIGLMCARNDWVGANFVVPKVELVQFEAFNQVAADRYILLIESTPAAVGGAAAIMQWGLPSGLGQSIWVTDINRRTRGDSSGLALFASSTPNALTSVGDVIISSQWR